MTSKLCKKCGKPSVAEHAGSVTSYFFQHNYCQCAANSKLAAAANATPLCSKCGKARPADKRAGSFTAFLFKELRCNCGDSAEQNKLKRTQTASRLAKKKQFTESLKSTKLKSSQSIAEAILPLDTTIGGIFRIVSLIGMGGMGVVYLVEQTSLKKLFALKVLAPDQVNQQNWLRFKSEAKTMASLNHPSFVKVYDLGIHASKIPYYAMDYLKGRSLEEILAEDGPLSIKDSIDIYLAVADALSYAHRNDIVHRDIKPANIMLCSDSDTPVKVLDFGISKLMGAESGQKQNLTLAGEIFGSPFYMSPEQCEGLNIDSRSDIYSLGCSLFETLTGYVPFEGGSSLEIMLMQREDQAPLLSEVTQEQKFPLELEAVLATCLEKKPKNRYQSASEFLTDLENIKRGKALAKDSPAREQLESISDRMTGKASALSVDNDVTKNFWSRKNLLLVSSAVLILISIGVFAMLSPKTKTEKVAKIEQTLDVSKAEISADNLAGHLDQTPMPKVISRITSDGRIIQFNFPEDQSMGEIGPLDRSGKFVNAQSQVTFSANTKLHFFAKVAMFVRPNQFDCFNTNDLYALTVPFDIQESCHVKQAIDSIARLTGLRILFLEGADIGDESIAALDKLTNLELIDVSSSNITGAGLAKLKNLKKLKQLYCGFLHDHSKALVAIQGSTQLQALTINALPKWLSIEDAKMIASCKNLKHLNLEGSIIDDKVLPILATLPKLSRIDLRGCRISTQATDNFIKQCLPRKIFVNRPEASVTNTTIFETESPMDWIGR